MFAYAVKRKGQGMLSRHVRKGRKGKAMYSKNSVESTEEERLRNELALSPLKRTRKVVGVLIKDVGRGNTTNLLRNECVNCLEIVVKMPTYITL